MDYAIIYYGYYALGGNTLSYWANRQSVPGEPLGRSTIRDSLLEKVRTPTASLVGERLGDRSLVIVRDLKTPNPALFFTDLCHAEVVPTIPSPVLLSAHAVSNLSVL